VEPAAERGGALGYDLSERRRWRAEMHRARRAAGPVVTRRLGLARLGLAPSQFVAMLSVFATGTRQRTPATRRSEQGFLLGVFDSSRIVEDALAPFSSSPVGIDVTLYDDPATASGMALFHRASSLRRTMQLPATAQVDPSFRYVR